MTDLTPEQIMEKAKHKVYQKAPKDSAEAAAWVFYNKDLFNKYYFNLPPLGDKEVRLRVLYSGVGQVDIDLGRERRGYHPRPVCPGQEVVAEVQALGKDSKRFKVGDKVLVGALRDSCGKCQYCTKGEVAFCTGLDEEQKSLYGNFFGGFSTHMQIPETFLVKLPDSLDIKTAAPIMGAGVSAFAPMREHLTKGMKVGVIGVGGIGHLAIQIGVKMGLEVDAFTSGEDEHKEQFILELGAEFVYYWKVKGALNNLKGKYDALIYTLPVNLDADVMDGFVSLLKPKGKLILVSTPTASQKLKVSFVPVVENKISIVGSTPEGINDVKDTLKFFAENKIRVICEEFAFDDFPRAVESVEFGHPRFKCVVNVQDYSQFFSKPN